MKSIKIYTDKDKLIIENVKKMEDIEKNDDFVSSFLYFIGLNDEELKELKKIYKKNKEVFKMYIGEAYAAKYDGNKLEVIDVLSNLLNGDDFNFFRIDPEDLI